MDYRRRSDENYKILILQPSLHLSEGVDCLKVNCICSTRENYDHGNVL